MRLPYSGLTASKKSCPPGVRVVTRPWNAPAVWEKVPCSSSKHRSDGFPKELKSAVSRFPLASVAEVTCSHPVRRFLFFQIQSSTSEPIQGTAMSASLPAALRITPFMTLERMERRVASWRSEEQTSEIQSLRH